MDSVMPDTPTTRPATAFEVLNATGEQVAGTGTEDCMEALRIAHTALARTAAANDLIDASLLAFGQVYWPGDNFLTGDRRVHLELAVRRLRAMLPTPPPADGPMTVLAPGDVAPQEYWPQCEDGVVGDPDPVERDRQLLLFRTQTVAAANRQVWVGVRDLLTRVHEQIENPKARKASRIASLLVDDCLRPDPGMGRAGIAQRILAIDTGR